ncbi:MAG: S8 family peptidase [Reichenbachiella sp.]
MNKWLTFILLLLSYKFVSAQDINRYIVFFADKENSKYAIDQPSEFLSERAIERRNKQSIAITIEDLPVNENYLDSLKKYGVQYFHSSKWFNAVLVETEEFVLQELVQKDFILKYDFVAPNQKLIAEPVKKEISFTSVDPKNVTSNSSMQLSMLGVEKMHEDGYLGNDILISVLDAGFYNVNQSSLFSHVFNNNRLIDLKNFVTNENDVFTSDDHGTSAFSCIASKSEVLTGTAPDASFALYITEDPPTEYRIEEYNWLFGAERADSLGTDIISSSLGYAVDFNDRSMDYEYEDTDGKTAVVSKAASMASDRGILVVASAGNEGMNLKSWPYIVMPSDVKDVLSVGAIDKYRNRAGFSSFGPTTNGLIKPDVVALGVNVSVYRGSNKISSLSGTSFSAPLISGLAAGLWEKFPTLRNTELKELITSSASKKINPDSLQGYGLPNYQYARSNEVLSVQLIMESVVSVYPNPFTSDHISIRIEKEYARQSINFTLYSPDGKIVNTTSIKKYKKGDVLGMKVNSLKKGMYLLNVSTDGVTKNVKLLRY